MVDPAGEKPKLIIDEDWKTQVEREREELRRAKDLEGAATDDSSASSSTQAAASQATSEGLLQGAADVEQPPAKKRPRSSAESAAEIPAPPPASFPFLVSMLGTQALVAMGQLPDEESPEVRLDYAKHYIDLLGLLEEKTKGNLTQEESSLLFDWLHQLRLGFVEVAKRHPK